MPNAQTLELYVPTVEDCLRDPTDFSVTFDDLIGPTLSRYSYDASTLIPFRDALKCAVAIEKLRQRKLEEFRRQTPLD